MSAFEREAAALRTEASRLHLREQLIRFVRSAIVAAAPLAAATHDWTWSAVAAVAGGALEAGWRQWSKTVNVDAAVAAIASAVDESESSASNTPTG